MVTRHLATDGSPDEACRTAELAVHEFAEEHHYNCNSRATISISGATVLALKSN